MRSRSPIACWDRVTADVERRRLLGRRIRSSTLGSTGWRTSAPQHIFQLGGGEFPPLKTLYQTNLPIPTTPFLGRERELREVINLLDRKDVRLLTEGVEVGA